MERVAEQLGVTARHLRRAFTENIGIGPKDFARAVRLQRAMKMAATSKDWARIAADAGYYDQAHLISDFRELVGLTPSAFLKRPRDRSGMKVFAGSRASSKWMPGTIPSKSAVICGVENNAGEFAGMVEP